MRRQVGFAFLLVGSAAMAEPVSLADEALRQTISGKTVNLDTPFGVLPITYKDDGTMSGKAGAMTLYLGSATDRGRWSVKGDRVCQKFFKWFSGEQNCLKIRVDGRKLTWRRDDGVTGTATIAANEAPPPAPPSGLGVPIQKEEPAPASAPVPSPQPLAPNAIEANAARLANPPRIASVAPLAPIERATPARAEMVAALGPAGRPDIPPLLEAPALVVRSSADQGFARRGQQVDWRQLSQDLEATAQPHRWCQPSALATAAPALMIAARQLEGLAEPAATDGGCLAAAPPLATHARAMLPAN